MAHQGNSGDVSSTLGELERKLRALEHELARVGRAAPEPEAPSLAVAPPPAAVPDPPAAPVAAAEPPAPPAPSPEAIAGAQRIAALEAQLDDLHRSGEELRASAARLLAAYQEALAATRDPQAPPAVAAPAADPGPALSHPPIGQGQEPPADLLARIDAERIAREQAENDRRAQAQAEVDRIAADAEAARRAALAAAAAETEAARAALLAAEARAAALTAPPASAPAVPAAATAPPAPPAAAVLPPAGGAAPVTAGGDPAAAQQIYAGAMTIDAGPFGDIAGLSDFEQALARVPGVRDVYVRGFQGERAVIDVDFAAPTALVPELQRAGLAPFVVNGADATGLVITITPESTHG